MNIVAFNGRASASPVLLETKEKSSTGVRTSNQEAEDRQGSQVKSPGEGATKMACISFG